MLTFLTDNTRIISLPYSCISTEAISQKKIVRPSYVRISVSIWSNRLYISKCTIGSKLIPLACHVLHHMHNWRKNKNKNRHCKTVLSKVKKLSNSPSVSLPTTTGLLAQFLKFYNDYSEISPTIFSKSSLKLTINFLM